MSAEVGITVNIPQFIQHLTNNTKSVEVIGSTVGECLEKVCLRFPQTKDSLFDKEGVLKANILIYVNRKSAYPNELGRPVKEGDILNIVIALAGG